MKRVISVVIAIAVSGCVATSSRNAARMGSNQGVQVNDQTHVVTSPSDFFEANGISRSATAIASNSAIWSSINTITATNVAQDDAIGSKVSTNEMGDGLFFSNNQWNVKATGTITNVDVNGIEGTVSNLTLFLSLGAGDIGALSTDTVFETWDNIPSGAGAITNVSVNGTNCPVSNGIAQITIPSFTDDLGWSNKVDATGTNAWEVGSHGGLATTGSLAVVSNTVAGFLADSTLTNVVVAGSNAFGQAKVGRTGYVYVQTNAPGSDASYWSTNAAVQTVDMAGYTLTNVGGLSVTGRLAIGFGVFSATNDVAAPASSNTWIVYAVRVGDSNRLMGVDYLTNRVWVTP